MEENKNDSSNGNSNWQTEEDSLISVETPLSQDTNLSLAETSSFIPQDINVDIEANNIGAKESGGDSTGANTSSNGSSSVHNWEFDLDELERPWPATFERSISLLAGPTMDTDFIDKVTRSPKITPNLSKRRVSELCHIKDLKLLCIAGIIPSHSMDILYYL